jgi:hypothetical protein
MLTRIMKRLCQTEDVSIHAAHYQPDRAFMQPLSYIDLIEKTMASQDVNDLVSAFVVGVVVIVAFLALILPLVLGLIERRH